MTPDGNMPRALALFSALLIAVDSSSPSSFLMVEWSIVLLSEPPELLPASS